MLAGSSTAQRVFWKGRHKVLKDASGNPLITPLGRLPRPVLTWLCTQLSWTEISLDEPTIPLFAFANKNCGDFGSAGTIISQLPQRSYLQLDDKLTLSRNIYRAELDLDGKTSSELELIPCTIEAKEVSGLIERGKESECNKVWFVKHRLGVKGKAVHVFNGLGKVNEWLKQHPTIAHDFVVQREVIPWLIDGCKFVIRVHVLLTSSPEKVYVHEQCICIVHQQTYTARSTAKDMQISSFGKPRKVFLLKENRELYQRVFHQLLSSVNKLHRRLRDRILLEPRGQGTMYYHLFGYDYAVDTEGQARLLEVNAFPALGTGTMAFVEKQVFTDLLQDLVKAVVLPVTNPKQATLPHRFVQAFPKTQPPKSTCPKSTSE